MSRPRPRGKVGGLARGVSRPKPPGGGVGGWVLGGSSGPHPGGGWGSGQWGHQAHTWGGGSQAHTQGGPSPGPGGCIPACTEADTPPQMATAAGSMHPTGMHACFFNFPASVNNKNAFQ